MGVKAISFVAVCLVIGSRVFGAPATPDAIFSFGDSLSDAGNASIALSGAYPGANYATRTVPGVAFPVGYFTDGVSTTPSTTSPIGMWVDQLAAGLGVADPIPALAPAGGSNYAVGGAMTGSTNLQDMQNQVNLFLSQHSSGASATSLYTFWGGANDLLAGNNPQQAADNISNEIKEVSAAGGKQFMWLNLPPLGAIPAGAANAAALNAATAAFNTEWNADLTSLKSSGVNVVGVDVANLFTQIQANPATFGFTDVTDPAQGVAAANPNTYLFWDGMHPTTEGDMDVANLALADLAAVPEPTCTALLCIGCAGLLKRRRI